MPQFNISDDPVLLYAKAAYPSGGIPITVTNNDDTAILYVERDESVNNASDQIGPQATLTFDGSRDVWASTLDSGTTISVQVVEGTTALSAAPTAIAESLIASGFAGALAVAIAQAMAQGGISIVSAAAPLYVGSSSPAPSGAAQVGASVFGAGGSQTYADQSTRAGASNEFDSYVGRPMATSVQKFYLTEGNWTGSRLNEILTTFAAFPSMKLIISVKPGRSPTGVYTNPNQVTLASSGATIAQEDANLTTFLNTLIANGITGANCDIINWNEANSQGFSGDFTAEGFYNRHAQHYNPLIQAKGFKACYNPLLANGHIADFYPGDAFVDAIYCDYYGWDYFKNGTIGTTLTSAYGDNPMALADNHLPSPIPFGIAETGMTDGTNKPSTADFVNWWNTQIIAPMSARLQAGKINAHGPVWFSGSETGGNHIDASTPATVIAAIQSAYDQLSANVVNPPGSGNVINGTSSITLVPQVASPGAGYAIAGQMAYSVTVRLQANATGSTNPFAVVKLFWFDSDDKNATAVDVQFWICPIGGFTGGPINIYGHGPQIAQFLKVQVQNLDTIACTASVTLTGESRVAEKHDWRFDAPSQNAVANAGNLGFNEVGGAFHANCVGSIQLTTGTLTAGVTKQFITSMYAGEVWAHWTSDSNKVTCSLQAVPTSSWGTAELWSPNGTVDDAIIGFPRSPVQVTITNTDTVAHSAHLEMIGID